MHYVKVAFDSAPEGASLRRGVMGEGGRGEGRQGRARAAARRRARIPSGGARDGSSGAAAGNLLSALSGKERRRSLSWAEAEEGRHLSSLATQGRSLSVVAATPWLANSQTAGDGQSVAAGGRHAPQRRASQRDRRAAGRRAHGRGAPRHDGTTRSGAATRERQARRERGALPPPGEQRAGGPHRGTLGHLSASSLSLLSTHLASLEEEGLLFFSLVALSSLRMELRLR